MTKEIKYNISRRITSYSKRKGSFQKLFSLAKGMTYEEMRKYIADNYISIYVSGKVNPEGFEASAGNKGFIYPDYIVVKKLGGKRSKELSMWQRSGGWGNYRGTFDLFAFAYTAAEAKRLILAGTHGKIFGNDLDHYFCKNDPLPMYGQLLPTEPCVWLYNQKEKTTTKLI